MRRVARVFLILFVFAIPWEYSLDFGAHFGNIARILGVVTAFAAVLGVLQSVEMKRLRALHWLTAALYLWFSVSYFWTTTPEATLSHLRWYAQEMMLVWLVWEFSDSAADLWRLMTAWLAGSWVLAILTLAAFVLSGTQTGQVRFVASGQDPNDVARFLDFGFPVAALLLGRGAGRISRILAFSYFPLGFGCVLLTASRSGLLVGVLALLGCGVFAVVEHSKRVAAGAIAIIAAAALIVASVPAETIGRLNSVSELWQRGDLNQRVNIWSAGWRAFKEAPILGHGAGSFVAAASLAPEDTAHNTALAILVEGGLCAFLLAGAIWLVCFNAIVRSRGSLRIVFGLLLCVWVLSSLVGSITENRITWLFFGIAALGERVGRDDPNEFSRLFDGAIGDCNRERLEA